MKGFCLERCYKLFGVRGVWCKKCWVYKLFGVKLFWAKVLRFNCISKRPRTDCESLPPVNHFPNSDSHFLEDSMYVIHGNPACGLQFGPCLTSLLLFAQTRLPSHTQGAYKDQSPRRFWSRRAALWRRRLSALAFFRPLTGTGGKPVKPISWEAVGRSAGSSAHAAITYHGAAPGGYRFLRTAPRLYTSVGQP